jgi:hypothetical protein
VKHILGRVYAAISIKILGMATLENRVYYGEYSLKHWINLMLTRNIDLPEYQRHFVWQERDIKRLIKSLKDKQFVQPVTIALYNVGGQKRNLILDGQQRLTSILLAYIGYIPDRKKFLEGYVDSNMLAGEDDSALDDSEGDSPKRNSILWKFSELLSSKNSKEDIIERISTDERYIKLTNREFTDLSDNFFENTFIGFSYIVPESTNQTEVQDVFSKLFRNINYFGKKLDALESRKSLYFQNMDLVKYFDGKTVDGSDVLCGIRIMENLQPYNIDFVRYLSILSQYYANNEDQNKVLVGYSAFGSRESFYADYVSYILGQGPDEQESRPEKFNGFDFASMFPENCWLQRFEILRQAIDRIKPNMGLNERNSFNTWIDADYWLMGLIYNILFKNRNLKEPLTIEKQGGTVTTLQKEINKIIRAKKSDEYYVRNINRLGNLRERLKDSCEIYNKYVQ